MFLRNLNLFLISRKTGILVDKVSENENIITCLNKSWERNDYKDIYKFLINAGFDLGLLNLEDFN